MIRSAIKARDNSSLLNYLVESCSRGIKLDVGTYVTILHYCHDHHDQRGLISYLLEYVNSFMVTDLSVEQIEYLQVLVYDLLSLDDEQEMAEDLYDDNSEPRKRRRKL